MKRELLFTTAVEIDYNHYLFIFLYYPGSFSTLKDTFYYSHLFTIFIRVFFPRVWWVFLYIFYSSRLLACSVQQLSTAVLPLSLYLFIADRIFKLNLVLSIAILLCCILQMSHTIYRRLLSTAKRRKGNFCSSKYHLNLI